jgi:hypothetical protein
LAELRLLGVMLALSAGAVSSSAEKQGRQVRLLVAGKAQPSDRAVVAARKLSKQRQVQALAAPEFVAAFETPEQARYTQWVAASEK